MSFFAIMAATAEGRIAKLREFVRQSDAAAHVALFSGMPGPPFVHAGVAAPQSHWRIDMAAKTIVIDAPPPPDLDAIDQAEIEDALGRQGSIIRALALVQFRIVNDVRALEGKAAITLAQYKVVIKGLMR